MTRLRWATGGCQPCVERLWRTVKYEEVYLKDYLTAWDAESNLEAYFRYYDHERYHSALENQTPAAVYCAGARSRRSRRLRRLCRSTKRVG